MYFDEKGAGNTEQCVVLALKTAAERNIRHIVVALSLIHISEPTRH